MSVEVIGPQHPLQNYHIMTYKEVMYLHKNKHKVRDIAETLDETKNRLVSLDIHQAVIDKIQNDANTYSTSKSTSQSLLNITVIQSQIFHLVSIIQNGNMNNWNIILIVLLSNSLILEFIIFVLLVLLAKSKTEQVTKYCTATPMNSWVTTLSGLLLIMTTAITIISKSTEVTLIRNVTI